MREEVPGISLLPQITHETCPSARRSVRPAGPAAPKYLLSFVFPSGMKLQDLDQRIPQLTAGHHLIHKAVFHLEFAALEPGGQLFTDGLLNNAGAGKADECPRFGQHDIAQACKAGGHAACGGVCQHADVQPALCRKALDGGAGLGHLHQAENALLHPRAAAGRKDDQRQALGGGVLHGAGPKTGTGKRTYGF